MCLAGLLRPGSDTRYKTAWNSVEHLCRANVIREKMLNQSEFRGTCGIDGDQAIICQCLEHYDDPLQLKGWCWSLE